jgi:hypothetical protein
MEDVLLTEGEALKLLDYLDHSSWDSCLLTLDKDAARALSRASELQAARIHKEAFRKIGDVSSLPLLKHN